MSKLSPIESEFETTEDAEAYDLWFRAKVEAALSSTKPRIPHDEAMALLDERLEARRAARRLEP
ncbi:MAG: stability determinant [Sphingomonas sp.]|nr:stability determinant [Sphingomonas sp.]